MARKQGNTWGPGELLPFSVDTVNYGHPCLSADGKMLYFASKMSGGYGGTDLWSCTFDAKSNAWGQPHNLGPNINTPGNEVYPTVSNDGKKFYFSSDYHPGLGGLDIFVTEIGADGKMNKPIENMKSPINSSFDDFGIVFEGKKNRGYFTSNREGGKGDDDIYSFSLPPLNFHVKGNVFCEGDDAGKGKGEFVENVKVKVIGSDGSINEVITGKDGSYNLKLKEKNTYTVTTETGKNSKSPAFNKDGFLANKDARVITTVGNDASKDFQADFAVKPVVPALHMPQILYDLGKADLLPQSKDSLNYLFNLMNDNPTTEIELFISGSDFATARATRSSKFNSPARVVPKRLKYFESDIDSCMIDADSKSARPRISKSRSAINSFLNPLEPHIKQSKARTAKPRLVSAFAAPRLP